MVLRERSSRPTGGRGPRDLGGAGWFVGGSEGALSRRTSTCYANEKSIPRGATGWESWGVGRSVRGGFLRGGGFPSKTCTRGCCSSTCDCGTQTDSASQM